MRLKKTFFGANCLETSLKQILACYQPRHVFLLTGKQSYQQSTGKCVIESVFAQANIPFTHFFDFDKNPKIEDVYKGVELFNATRSELVLAIGGGSVLDIAKLINLFANPQNDLKEYLNSGHGINVPGLPLVAIPTTAGTGSEATHFSVLYVNQQKYSVAHAFMKPRHAIIDATLTYQQGAYLAATCAMDTLTQAIESFWAVNATPKSQRFAKKAIQLCQSALTFAVNKQDTTACQRMSMAAYLAGCAIDISKTTAAHAFSYALTMKYGISHGHAVALTLPLFMKINAQFANREINDKRGHAYLAKTIQDILNLLECQTIDECALNFKSLMQQIGLANNLKDFGIKAYEEFSYLVDAVNVERLGNNPVKIHKAELLQLIQEEFV
jgi:alcohol dehydrogenase class IV